MINVCLDQTLSLTLYHVKVDLDCCCFRSHHPQYVTDYIIPSFRMNESCPNY